MSFFGGFSLSPMATRALYASDNQEGEAPATKKVLAESKAEGEQTLTDQGSSGVEDVPSNPGVLQTAVEKPQRQICLFAPSHLTLHVEKILCNIPVSSFTDTIKHLY